MEKKLFDCILWGLSSGIIGAVYKEILAEEPAFNFWWRFGAAFEDKWFFKPVWGCAFCISGQVALWSYFFLRIMPAVIDAVRLRGFSAAVRYLLPFQGLKGLFCLIITISAAILTGKILSWYLQKKIL